ncbi:MAG: OmpA family protein [Bacteroidota bacterium]
MCNNNFSFDEKWKAKPHEGKAAAGFHYESGLIGTLIQPLEKDTLYKVSAYFYSVFTNPCNINVLGVVFRDSTQRYPVELQNKYIGNGQTTPYYFIYPDGVFNEKNYDRNRPEWHRLTSYFKAKGGEQELFLGCFQKYFLITPDRDTIFYDLGTKKCEGYFDYFLVDDVVVEKYHDTIAQDRPLVLENIYFESNKFELLPASFVALDNLTDYLLLHTECRIEIFGHTDNVGEDVANISLSLKRATSVKRYLVGGGVAESRISAMGFGSTKPLAENETEAGRQKNRRIEIKLSR